MNQDDRTRPSPSSRDPAEHVVPPAANRADADPSKRAEHACELALWRYDLGSENERVHSFEGHVTYVGGAEGERLRGALSVVIRDLLEWAARDSGADGSADQETGEAAA